MALDETLFRLNSRPTLRFYSWLAPVISTGYFQKNAEHTLERFAKKGFEVVRRPTGGRAIFHNDEITYSAAAKYEDFPPPHTLKGIYKTLALWQINSLSALGIEAEMASGSYARRDYRRSESCFMTSTPYEVCVKGRKISGGAQKRGGSAFMQHGSILIDSHPHMLSLSSDPANDDEDRFTTLKKEGCACERSHIINIMIEKFEETIGCILEKGELTVDEAEMMKELESKYIRTFSVSQP